jgi:hypothetical protein
MALHLSLMVPRYCLQLTPTHNSEGQAAQMFGLTVGTRRASSVIACAKKSTDRGVGRIPTECPAGHEKNGLLCVSSWTLPLFLVCT